MSLEWIENVPESWTISESQFVLNFQKRDVLETDEIVTAFRDGQVTLRSNRRTDGFTMAEKEIGYQHICEGDLVIHSMDGGFGAIGVSDSCGKASPVVHAYTSSRCDLRFVAYQLRAAVNAGWVAAQAKGIRVRSTQFDRPALASFKMAYPPLETQQRIADYLDRETSEIDAAVADLDRYVQVLEARKVVVLAKAFPDPNDSHMEGDSKFEGWEKRPLWSMFIREKNLGFVDEPMVSVFRDRGVVFKEAHENLNQTAEDRSIYQLVEPGWFVVNRMKAWQGSVGISEIRGITSGHYICFRPIHNENHKFMNYLLRSPGYKTWYQNYSRGVRPGQAEIDNGWLVNLPIFVPPMNIQNEIVEYLGLETSKIDSLIADSTKLRDLLLKRRSVLISDVVTGRKQV